jgi:flavin-dependent dehydrogenase
MSAQEATTPPDVSPRIQSRTNWKPDTFDVVIIGAGPAGSACALSAGRAGLRAALVERAVFPRHKVCGDCLNPDVWPVLESLGSGVADTIRALPHTTPGKVRFVSAKGREVIIPVPGKAERVILRQSMDDVLLNAARRAGTKILEDAPLTAVRRLVGGAWRITTGPGGHTLNARALIAADGRNSTTCRLLNLFPSAASPRHGSPSPRMALQCHIPGSASPHSADAVSLEWTPYGYCGLAPVVGGLLNLCVVCQGNQLTAAKEDAARRYGTGPETAWHSIAPIERAPLPPAPPGLPGLFLTGDAARVVEPFTGEGIFYALSTGLLAAEAARRYLTGSDGAGFYRAAHARLYRQRLWINRIAGVTVTRPRLAETVLSVSRRQPTLLRWLTAKVIS